MATTPNKSDAKGGAGVIRLYPHKSTERAIAKAQERLDKGQLSKRGHRLTGKQEIFCQRIVDGLTQADAIRAAYDVSNSSDQAIYVMGCKAMANPKIVERIGWLPLLAQTQAGIEAVEAAMKESLAPG